MTGWIITGCILLFLLFLLGLRVTAIIDYCQDLRLKVSVLGITVFKIPSTKKKKRKKKKKSPQDEQSSESEQPSGQADTQPDSNADDTAQQGGSAKPEDDKAKAKKKPRLTLSEIIDLVKLVLDSLGKPLKKMLKRVSVSHFTFHALCGGEDAAKAAINYGTTNYLLGVLLNLFDEWLTLKTPDEIKVNVDFYKEKTEIEAYLEIRLTVGSALAFAFVLLFRAIRYYLSHDEAKSAIKKVTGK